MFVFAPLEHVLNDDANVVATAQSTVALCVWVSALIFVKSPEVNESVTRQVIFVPSEIFWETEVSVAPAEIDKLEEAV